MAKKMKRRPARAQKTAQKAAPTGERPTPKSIAQLAYEQAMRIGATYARLADVARAAGRDANSVEWDRRAMRAYTQAEKIQLEMEKHDA
jgi:hypothetical protein